MTEEDENNEFGVSERNQDRSRAQTIAPAKRISRRRAVSSRTKVLGQVIKSPIIDLQTLPESEDGNQVALISVDEGGQGILNHVRYSQ